MWDSCAICHYLLGEFLHGIYVLSKIIVRYDLDLYDFDRILSPTNASFRADLHRLSFYSSGTLDNLSAYSSPIQRVITETMPGKNKDVVDKNRQFFFKVAGPLLLEQVRIYKTIKETTKTYQ